VGAAIHAVGAPTPPARSGTAGFLTSATGPFKHLCTNISGTAWRTGCSCPGIDMRIAAIAGALPYVLDHTPAS
jgi:hypothetical protein